MKGKGILLQAAALATLLGSVFTTQAYAGGAAYTMTNSNDNNQIIVFNRSDDGLLTQVDSVATGGKGSGGNIDPLGSQGSLILVDADAAHHGWRRHRHQHNAALLLAVNAGSNDLSVFRVAGDKIAFQDRIGTGGTFPVSVTVYGNMVYVLNNGVPANITGFRLDGKGHLHPAPHTTRLLGDGSYGQVAFDPEGKFLVITDKADNQLLVYRVGAHGIATKSPAITASSGEVPFGVDFDRQGHLLVVEAGANAVSSYVINHDGSLLTLSASVPNGQAATCWIVVNQRGDIVTTNPGTNSLSSYHVDSNSGQVTLLIGTAGAANAPLDIDMSSHGRFAYAVDPGNGGVDMFRVESDGSLTGLGTVAAGLAIYAQGMAVN
jgi:6-phosphogluconolactonase